MRLCLSLREPVLAPEELDRTVEAVVCSASRDSVHGQICADKDQSPGRTPKMSIHRMAEIELEPTTITPVAPVAHVGTAPQRASTIEARVAWVKAQDLLAATASTSTRPRVIGMEPKRKLHDQGQRGGQGIAYVPCKRLMRPEAHILLCDCVSSAPKLECQQPTVGAARAVAPLAKGVPTLVGTWQATDRLRTVPLAIVLGPGALGTHRWLSPIEALSGRGAAGQASPL